MSKIKQLVYEWNDQYMPILFGQLFPKEYDALEKKIIEKNKKGESVILTLLASFIKPLVADLLKYINVKELYDGLVAIANYIGADELVKDDIQYILKYLPKRSSAENKKIIMDDFAVKYDGHVDISKYIGAVEKSKPTSKPVSKKSIATQKLHANKVEETLRPEMSMRRATKSKMDPNDIRTWPLTELRDFMREHNLKGISKKKAEIIDIIQRYIS